MIELKLNQHFPRQLIACDEVGRGPLGGPVVAGAVSVTVSSSQELKKLITYLRSLGIDDSKALSEKERLGLLEKLGLTQVEFRKTKVITLKNIEIKLVTWELDQDVIDQENILWASMRAMKEAALHLSEMNEVRPLVLIDGNRTFKWDNESLFEEVPIVKGDSKSKLIALASILAKFIRDEYMKEMHVLYPQYGFDQHAGYPTVTHRKAIETYGPSPIHRKTFKGVKEFIRA